MERVIGSLELSMKRMQMPGTFIPVKCPVCGEVAQVEIIDQIYYPGEENPDHGICIECEECDVEVERKIDIVSVIVTLDVHEPQII